QNKKTDTNKTTTKETPDTTNNQTNKRPKKWTVMVYLAGDNNLSDDCVFAISEMNRATLNENVKVIVQLTTGVFENVRLHIKHEADPGQIKKEFTEERDKQVEEQVRRIKEARRGQKKSEAHGHLYGWEPTTDPIYQ